MEGSFAIISLLYWVGTCGIKVEGKRTLYTTLLRSYMQSSCITYTYISFLCGWQHNRINLDSFVLVATNVV